MDFHICDAEGLRSDGKNGSCDGAEGTKNDAVLGVGTVCTIGDMGNESRIYWRYLRIYENVC